MTRAAVMRPIDVAPRRGLRRDQAAAYMGVSPSKFGQMVAEGRLPAPFSIDGCVVWDLRDLDAAFDELKYVNDVPTKAIARLARI